MEKSAQDDLLATLSEEQLASINRSGGDEVQALRAQVARLEAANKRLAAALKAAWESDATLIQLKIKTDEGEDIPAERYRTWAEDHGRLRREAATLLAALSDTGEGWLEQVARVKKAAQPLLSGGPVGCYHCTVEVGGDGQPRHGRGCPAQEFRAALDALGGK